MKKRNKRLDEMLGIKHIAKPKDLPTHKDNGEGAYTDPDYPYESDYTKLPPKNIFKKVDKSKARRLIVKTVRSKQVVQTPPTIWQRVWRYLKR